MRLTFRSLTAAALLGLLLSGCAQLPKAGPASDDVRATDALPGTAIVQVVDVTDAVARRLLAQRRQRLFSEALGEQRVDDSRLGTGDGVEVHIWEAPPATLFGAAPALPGLPSTSIATVLPEQLIDREGYIAIPFVGRVRAAGQTPQAIGSEITRRLLGKANQPEVLVRPTRNGSSTVTVVGEVATSLRMPLTPSGERLLDALAAAGGVRQPVNKTTVQVTRGADYYALPLDQVIRDPRQNVPLRAGDVVTALFQTLSFTALGATGRNEEVAFEAQGITLAQGLARVGGLLDNRANPEGLFVFRFEPADAIDWPRQPAQTTPEGKVPVVYRVDLRNPASFFVMQSFALENKDVMYVSNASGAELQKFLNLVVSALFPVLNLIQTTR